MSLFLLGILIGALYAFGGMRALMILDDIFDPGFVSKWMADRELFTWSALVLWPLAVLVELILQSGDWALVRWLRKGVRS